MFKLIGPQPTISRKIVDVLKLGNLEKKTIHTPPSSHPFKLGVFVFSTVSVNSGTTLYGEI